MEKPNLQPEVTVFVIKAGYNINYDQCIKALQNQTSTFIINEIKDIAPMSKAFNEMLLRCKTPYYIQVDQDFVLNNNAIEVLYKLISTSDSDIAIWNCLLYDEHLDMNICGVKIYKHAIMKNYPYNLNSNSCEKTQIIDMEKDGFKLMFDPNNTVLGKHSPKWTNDLVFERYYTLMGKSKEFKYTWLEKLPIKLKDKFVQNPNNINFYAMMGAFANIMKGDTGLDGEKKFYELTKSEFGLLEGWMDSKPTLASFHITSKCNLACEFCDRQTSGNKINHKDFDLNLVDVVLRKFSSINSVCLAGFGEPFLNPSLGYIIQKLHSNKKMVGLITNGTLLNEKIEEIGKIYQGLPDYISVSLNASNKEDYKKRTSKDYFNLIVDGIAKTRKLFPQLSVEMTYVCAKDSFDGIKDFLELANKLDVKGVHLLNLLPHSGFDKNSYFKDNVLTFEDQCLIDKIKTYPFNNKILSYPTLISLTEPNYRSCKFAWSSVSVDGDGSISPCLCVDRCDSQNGSIYDGIVFNNLAYSKLRESLLSINQRKQCKYCFRNWSYNE